MSLPKPERGVDSPAPVQDPAVIYRERCATYGEQQAQLAQRARRNGNLNLLLFFASFAVLTVASVLGDGLWYALAGVLALTFVAALISFQRLKRQAARAATLAAINQEGLHRLDRNWSQLPSPPPLPPPLPPLSPRPAGQRPPAACQPTGNAIDPATAADLDLLGPCSVQHLLNTPTTPIGQVTFRTWLLEPAMPVTARARQAAVRELAPLVAFRDEVGARGRQMGEAQAHYERFVVWAEDAPWLAHQPLWLWLARLLPLLSAGVAGAAWFYGERYPQLYWVLGALLLACLVLALTGGRRAGETIAQVEAQQEVFGAYAELFDLLSAQNFTDPQLLRLQAQLSAGAHAPAQMRRLQRLMPLASIRRWVLFFPVEVVTLWNIHLLWLLEQWQRDAGAHVRGWLAALGEMEALIALGTLHFDHPAWTFPELDSVAENGAADGSSVRVEGRNVAHPLLPPARAVGNDMVVGPPGTFLLVTGSNMSGKSTLLRAIGVNCILAQMGAPVCAAQLRLPPLVVASSMRVQDSLAEGVSFFMAELQGLRAVVQLAEERRDHGQAGLAPVLYLLDEILQGTNTAERQIAARHIIRRLLDTGAIGAVSTHDLTLAAAPELAAAATAVHFTESFTRGPEGPAMHFDYTLRPGVATSTNALKLMEIVGLA